MAEGDEWVGEMNGLVEWLCEGGIEGRVESGVKERRGDEF